MGTVLYNIIISPIEMIFEMIFGITYGVVFSYGTDIVILSLVVNFLVLPLYRQADILQKDAVDKEKKLEKWKKHINKHFKSDERYMILSAYYKEAEYSPIHQLSASLPLLIQIPFFIAAYHFLSNNQDLSEAAFGPIADLGSPDGLIKIGALSINLLPILMTVFNIISGAIYTKGSTLSQKIQLYGMAILFLIVLYPSPSGLVFYWTLNNLFSLLKNLITSLKDHRFIRAFILYICTVSVEALMISSRWWGNKRLVYIAVAATATAVLLAACEIIRKKLIEKGRIKNTENKKIEKSDLKEYTKLHWIAVLAMIFITGLLIPSSVIGDSPLEFVSPTVLADPGIYVLNSFFRAAGLFGLWFSVYFYLTRKHHASGFVKAELAAAGIFITDHMFFGTDYGTMSSRFVYDNEPVYVRSEMLVNLAVIAGIIAAVLLISRFLKKEVSGRVFTVVFGAVAAVLLFMSVLNIVKINRKFDEFMSYRTESDVPGQKKAIHFSKNGKNVVVLMLDRALGLYIPYLTAEKPELKEGLDGFVYYPNSIAHGKSTIYGAPGLFGGYDYTPDAMNKRSSMSNIEKHDEALKVMPKLFSENGFNVSVIDPPYAGYQEISDLSIYNDLDGVDAYLSKSIFPEAAGNSTSWEYLKKNKGFRYAVFRCAPVIIRGLIYDEGNYYDPMSRGEDGSNGVYYTMSHLMDMTEIDDSADNNILVMNSDITHEPRFLTRPGYQFGDRSGNPADHIVRADDGSEINIDPKSVLEQHYDANMFALMRLTEFFDELKEQGVYDNTRIIIVSDHGRDDKTYPGMLYEGAVCMLLVKDYNSRGALSTDNTFMTNCDVPAIATEGLIDDPHNPYTGNSIDMEPKKEKQLIIASDYWDASDQTGNVFELGETGCWYSVHDDIFDPDNWEKVSGL